MHRSFLTLACFDKTDNHWNVVIETPRGGRHKYKYEPKMEAFTLHRILPEGMSFPLDFGFLPGTKAPDGDPLDVLVMIEDPTFTGCVVPCQLIGVIEAIQTEEDGTSERNDRLIAVPLDTRNENQVRTIKDLDRKQLTDIESFFKFYNQVFGKRFKVEDVAGPKKAEKIARAAIRRFRKPRRK
jgi:inorganic pyrophosphatase